MKKIPIDSVQFVKELYPRFEQDNETINQYSKSVDRLPPIVVSRDGILIDGAHRLTATRLEGITEISAEIMDIDRDRILLEANRRNSTHGKQLSTREKGQNARRLYQKMTKMVKAMFSTK